MDYARINLQYTGVLAVLLLATVVWLDAGPAGWILANIVAWVSVLPYGLAVIKRYWAPSVRLSHLYPALAVGLPLVPHALAHWGLALSDRLVLAGIVSDEQLGVYSVGYQAAAFSGMLLTGLNWTVMSRYAQHQRASDLSTLLPTVVKQATFTIAICTCWVLLMPAVVSVVMPAAFESSADVVPLVALGYGFLGLYFIPANVLTMTLGKTYWLWACTVLAAIANVGFNLLAVPSMGIEGAAAGTALAYAVLFMLTTALALRTLKSRRQPQVFTNVA